MMSSLGQRLERARKHAQMKQRQVADRLGISSQAISQWESDRTRPSTDRLGQIARLYGVGVHWLLNGSGTMAEDGASYVGAPDRGRPVPVINRVQAGDWTEVDDPYAPGAGDEVLLTDLNVSAYTFALEIDGLSMSPDFQPGDRVIIDPEVAPRPGEFVVAKRDQDQEATFKKYRLRGYDDQGREVIDLVPLNPDWPTLVIDADTPGRIVGTMVEHRRYRVR